MQPRPRPIRAILDELATVERYLADAPPHAGAGLRDDLARRAARLRQELADVRGRQPGSEPRTDTNDTSSPG